MVEKIQNNTDYTKHGALGMRLVAWHSGHSSYTDQHITMAEG
jgi:hypothetical protein